MPIVRNRFLAAGLLALNLIAAPLPARAADECPDIGLLNETTRLTAFKPGSSRTLDDMTFDIGIQGLANVVCKEDGRRSRVTLGLLFQVQRGRSDVSGKVAFSYFVAIRHRVTQEILIVADFPVAFDFPKDRATVTVEEEVDQMIPLKKDEKPAFYSILVGLKLSEDQLAYNRARRGETPEERAAKLPPPAMPTLPGLPGQPPAGQPPAGQPPAGQPGQAPAPQARPPATAGQGLPQLPKAN